jgi:hypothetical protein
MKNKIKLMSSKGTRLEVGQDTTLTMPGGKGKVRWSTTDPNQSLVRLKPQNDGTCDVEGVGFGQVTINATDEDQTETFTLYVGSVVIAGADGLYWQLTADGQATRLKPTQMDPEVLNLVNANAIVADLTRKSKAKAVTSVAANTTPTPSEAVTCYVLNLKSFTLK